MYTVNGKLFIAGEYAVVEPGHTAIIQNIPLAMQAEIKFTEHESYIDSSIFDYAITWQYKADKPNFNPDKNYALIQTCIQTISKYLIEQDCELKHFNLTINSQLHDNQQNKYGLGSSGAVVVLVIKAMLSLYRIDYTDEKLFKLAAIVLLNHGHNGSMGDIACIAYDNLIAYKSFDRIYIKNYLNEHKISQTLAIIWPGLNIEVLANQLSYSLLIGWTQQHADSTALVKQAQSYKTSVDYQDFLDQSEKWVTEIINGFKTGQATLVKQGIICNREILQDFAKLTQIKLESTVVTKVLDRLQTINIAAKTSGAGAGDCIFALAFSEPEAIEIKKVWQANQIILLKELARD